NARCESRAPRRRTAPQHAASACRLDHGSATDQAGREHAHALAAEQRSRRARRLSRDAQMSSDAAAADALERAWTDPPTLLGWICTVDHKAIGRRFIVTALLFFAAAGVLGGLIRHQLATPNSTLLGPD